MKIRKMTASDIARMVEAHEGREPGSLGNLETDKLVPISERDKQSPFMKWIPKLSKFGGSNG